jgi:hypothetical protein
MDKTKEIKILICSYSEDKEECKSQRTLGKLENMCTGLLHESL